jgi:hypothetical protein
MPFHYLLTNLLVDVPSAIGAIFLDPEGEAVEWVSRHDDPYQLKIEGAYQGIFKRKLEALAGDLGGLRAYAIEGEHLVALTHALPQGYYVVLVLDRSGSRAHAMHHLRRTARVLAREIA